MLLDSAVFTGRVIDRLQQFAEELVVDKEDFSREAIGVQFFPIDKLLKLDPEFPFPGYDFNTGQFVVTTGRIAKADFDGLLDWEQRSVKHPEVFQKGRAGSLQLRCSAQSTGQATDAAPRAFHGLARRVFAGAAHPSARSHV
jgi:hypothetical protein